MATKSKKVLVPGTEDDEFSSTTEELEVHDTVSYNPEACDIESSEIKSGLNVEDEENIVDLSSSEVITGEDPASVRLPDADVERKAEGTSDSTYETISSESMRIRGKIIPPPGTGQRIYKIDPMLSSHCQHLDYSYDQYRKLRASIDKHEGGLEVFSRGYEKFGFVRSETGITYHEWAPGAKVGAVHYCDKLSAALIGDFNNWNANTENEFGVWEIFLPNNADGSPVIPHGSHVKIRMDTPSGVKDSIPAWIKFSVQAPGEIPYNGIYYDPPEEDKHVFKHPRPKKPKSLRIYESHVGMSSKEPVINTYVNFRDEVLPRIKKLGYNAVQIMAIQEHSYYASFGRLGTPDELKSLIDRAHELGLLVLMDIVHSHSSNNTLDGLNMFDGTDACYFHSGSRGYHWMFLLSNARWWLDEYKFDGFRFDGVAFTGNYNEYFGFPTDVDAVVYLMLVNDMIHGPFPEALSIGEDVSGMPAFCIPLKDGGIGFDYRLHMAIADKWIEMLKKRDEDWKMGDIIHTLTNRRWMEKCVSYAESHDQALVGDKTIAFWLMDKDMYDFMALDRPSTPVIDRGIALHKMIRLITMGLGGEGYLNFMGNEFGHPEWIDFPRADQYLPNGEVIPGNGFSYDKCRRRFDLGDADYLRYRGLQEFDRAMQHLEETYGFMTSEHQYISKKDEGDRIIVFERDDLVFVFNFHWSSSYSDYRVGCLKPGKYKVVLDSDDSLFGGFNRISHDAEYFTFEGWHDERPRSFLTYAPSRTAVVYSLVTDKAEPVDVETSIIEV
ncbi:hypothetical protein SASPL_111749 [Salvia splendens]|uniref:1,4-alpha-glucan branching enzyme n=1 Tax=Salvia splendens TaxID=180675 RepID=A0A8X8YD46_SALSN|nr:hypothetical protein SASPL_111749 [Salvia splendens]